MEELNRLLKDRFNEIWINGRFIASHIHYNYLSILYSLDKDFIELIYDKSSGKIIWISIADEGDLQKYLDEVDIDL